MNLERYLQVKHKGSAHWFLEEVSSYDNQERLQGVLEKKKYLDGQHKILQRGSFKYNGQVIEPRKIVIQMAKTILNFQTQYLLKNSVNIIGAEKMVEQFLKVNKLGRFDDKNVIILSKLMKFGQVAEYLFINAKGRIDSKIINAEDGTPVFNHHGEMIAFVEHYVFDGITYYTVYTDKLVQEWSNEGGELKLAAQHVNLSGLPILYRTDNEFSNTEGRSELDDYMGILDNMEDVLSKYVDSMYKFMNPIPVAVGQQLKDSLPSEIVGGGLNLDDGADFKMVTNQLDSKSFELVYKTLQQALLDVSSTPAVSMNKTDVSNLSEVSIKLLFSLADTKAGLNETYLKKGFYERWEKVCELLKYKGVHITEDDFMTLEFNFQYNTPSNHAEIIDNMSKQHAMGALSVETILEQSPYVNDITLEMNRILDVKPFEQMNQGNNVGYSDDTEKVS
ncbi:phage portal protein [Lysinibacillus sp. NPDC056232]|uniref:phage portal protein n=1 Tax=Lysinibacillus sp. NPDC056232 TaxID=3345756 RepID=UPI0035E0283E